MKRRPGRLIRQRCSLGCHEIEPEIFVSRSCVGDQFFEFRVRFQRPKSDLGTSNAQVVCPGPKSERHILVR